MIEAHQAFLAARPANRVTLPEDSSDFDALLSAIESATIGEVTTALRGTTPLRIQPELRVRPSDGAAFESLREESLEAGISVQPRLTADTKLSRARFEFARDILTAGGFVVLDPTGNADPTDPRAAIAVICGDDESVDAFLASHASDQHTDQHLVIAGAPRATATPVAAFLHRGGDALHALRELYLAAVPELPEDEA